MTGARRSCSMAARTAARSGSSSFSVELTKTRRRWSGVRITAGRTAMRESWNTDTLRV